MLTNLSALGCAAAFVVSSLLTSCTGSSPKQIDVGKPPAVNQNNGNGTGPGAGNSYGTGNNGLGSNKATSAEANKALGAGSTSNSGINAGGSTGNGGGSSSVPPLTDAQKTLKTNLGRFDGKADDIGPGMPWKIVDSSTDPTTKKGIMISFIQGQSQPHPEEAKMLGASWWYTRDSIPPTGTPADAPEFVPMVYDLYNIDQVLSVIPGSAKTILGFNEPDWDPATNAARLSVDDAINGWSKVVAAAKGKKIGSPAVHDETDGWLKDFMTKAATNNLKVDFVAIHCYPDLSNGIEAGVKVLEDLIDKVHNDYGKNVWVTEFSPLKGGNYSPAVISDFMTKATKMMDNKAYVERYAWFSSNPFTGFEDYALYNDSVNVLDLGKTYTNLGK